MTTLVEQALQAAGAPARQVAMDFIQGVTEPLPWTVHDFGSRGWRSPDGWCVWVTDGGARAWHEAPAPEPAAPTTRAQLREQRRARARRNAPVHVNTDRTRMVRPRDRATIREMLAYC